MTEPLHIRFSAQDPEIMSANLALTSPGTTIEKRSTGRFSADVNAVRLGGLAVLLISTQNIRVLTEPTRACTWLTIPFHRGFEIDRCRHCEHYDNDCATLQELDRPIDLSSADTTVLGVNFDRSLLTTTTSKLGGDRQELPPGLHRRISLSNQNGARLWRAARSLWSRAGKEQGSPASAIARDEKELAAALLLAAGIDDGPPLSAIARRRSVAAMNRAEDWILANLDQPICRADLCAVSGLQPRALTRAFAKYHGEGPMHFVRERRLDAVHKTLLVTDPVKVTVTRVATDMGFYHLGRFAADYFAAFGEHPSETLRDNNCQYYVSQSG